MARAQHKEHCTAMLKNSPCALPEDYITSNIPLKKTAQVTQKSHSNNTKQAQHRTIPVKSLTLNTMIQLWAVAVLGPSFYSCLSVRAEINSDHHRYKQR